jgi:hypothetical protein
MEEFVHLDAPRRQTFAVMLRQEIVEDLAVSLDAV